MPHDHRLHKCQSWDSKAALADPKVTGPPNKSHPFLGVVLQLWWVSESPRQLAKNADSWGPLPGSLIL